MPLDSNGVNKLDYPTDSHTPLLHPNGHSHGHSSTGDSQTPSLSGDFFEQVAEGIQERDRAVFNREMMRYVSFVWAVLNCLGAGSITSYSLYGHLFQERLRYSQLQVNLVSITAEIAMYLPVSAFGYLCDRYGPRVPSALSGIFFGGGYLLAAFAYRSGPPAERGGEGWPFWTMVVSFVGVGLGTSCMYLSAVTTCAKNFGRGKHKGIALAVPIAAFGLSGMCQSQVGSRLLYERTPDGGRGDVDVFRFFIFLAAVLCGLGIVGSFILTVVDEEEMIDEAIEELERSGLLDEHQFFRQAADQHGYGSIPRYDLSESQENMISDTADVMQTRAEEERRRKNWLLNEETRMFLADKTMWWFASGFFLITGPGEAFINNLGTVIRSLYPPSVPTTNLPTSAATHVSIVAITSTIARLLTGTLTDLLAPPTSHHQHRQRPTSMISSIHSLPSQSNGLSVSRMAFLILFALLLSAGQLLLASGLAQGRAGVFAAVSSLVGAGYGAVFSLVPIVTSVVWGVENFGTNWGIIAMVPAGGAALWGLVYSAVYQAAASNGAAQGGVEAQDDVMCYGARCYAPTFWAMAVSVWLACGLWAWAWKGPGGWNKRGIAV
ncbi:MFS general substrate transporter [Eremomyces bilateralis CBS 781.70]|uniref:Probable transporter MCH1 n=1 Tax=Eremomyces bilateralis CBS 781.70 TaxID=1392243 RepID=A0A6G1G8M5_9PEZI|nr:MFS general substrate transporter [Eremomyces bilateralis CBS 781.70]KAF1814342.1 MFS general substrate transporter [Eremomyces bilateralis CBS 781.70]